MFTISNILYDMRYFLYLLHGHGFKERNFKSLFNKNFLDYIQAQINISWSLYSRTREKEKCLQVWRDRCKTV